MMLIGLFLLLVLAMFVYMSAWFALGFLYLGRIDSVDSAWGLGFIYAAAIALVVFQNYEKIPLLGFALVIVWGARLFVHITARNIRKSEDARYQIYREKFASNLNLLVFGKIFLIQGALILAVSTASVAVIISDSFNKPVAYVGLFIWAFGIIFEAIADAQLRSFLKQKTGKIMSGGLWGYSRHPNYFGEITTWTGAAVVACSAGQYWGIIGPLTITYLIVRVSGLPPIEKKYENDKDYQKYKKRTSALIPLPPKR